MTRLSLSYAAALALTLAALSGCAPDARADEARDGTTTRVEVPPGTRGVTVTPSTAAPGETVELTFRRPREVRGLLWSLATGPERTDVVWYLATPTRPRQQPTWWPAGEERAVVDLGLTGRGPDRLVVPDDAAPGDYLLCSANAAKRRCATLTVTSP